MGIITLTGIIVITILAINNCKLTNKIDQTKTGISESQQDQQDISEIKKQIENLYHKADEVEETLQEALNEAREKPESIREEMKICNEKTESKIGGLQNNLQELTQETSRIKEEFKEEIK